MKEKSHLNVTFAGQGLQAKSVSQATPNLWNIFSTKFATQNINQRVVSKVIFQEFMREISPFSVNSVDLGLQRASSE